MCVVGTPRGHNAYDLYEQAAGNDDWVAAVYRASETGILDDEELQAARDVMTPDQYEQEFECSWVANVPGSIYGKELQQALEEGRITNVPHDPATKVHTFWDLGVGDSTAIWFAQVGGAAGRGVHVIDYYEARGEGLPHYCSVLSRKNYLYGIIAPHDIEVRELGTGKSRREVAWDLGPNFRVLPKPPVEEAYMLGRCLYLVSILTEKSARRGSKPCDNTIERTTKRPGRFVQRLFTIGRHMQPMPGVTWLLGCVKAMRNAGRHKGRH